MATRAPCLAKRRAAAKPIPRALAPPEMAAVLPESSICPSRLLWEALCALGDEAANEKFAPMS